MYSKLLEEEFTPHSPHTPPSHTPSRPRFTASGQPARAGGEAMGTGARVCTALAKVNWFQSVCVALVVGTIYNRWALP